MELGELIIKHFVGMVNVTSDSLNKSLVKGQLALKGWHVDL